MVIDPMSFQNMMTDDDYKNHIKKQLAYALAERIMETNRASFTYVKNPLNYTTTVIGRVKL
jgi:hypothetical protein